MHAGEDAVLVEKTDDLQVVFGNLVDAPDGDRFASGDPGQRQPAFHHMLEARQRVAVRAELWVFQAGLQARFHILRDGVLDLVRLGMDLGPGHFEQPGEHPFDQHVAADQ